jgi:hypothetical protein
MAVALNGQGQSWWVAKTTRVKEPEKRERWRRQLKGGSEGVT